MRALVAPDHDHFAVQRKEHLLGLVRVQVRALPDRHLNQRNAKPVLTLNGGLYTLVLQNPAIDDLV